VEQLKYLGTTLTNQNFYSGRNLEQTDLRDCLQAFGAESCAFQFAIQNLKVKINRTIILPVILYTCETGSLSLREEPSLMLSENRVLRKIFGHKRDEETGE